MDSRRYSSFMSASSSTEANRVGVVSYTTLELNKLRCDMEKEDPEQGIHNAH